MRRSTIGVVLALATMLSTAVSVKGQSPDPWMGTWKLNLAKSKYDPGPPPKSSTLKHEPWKGGLKATTDTVGASGRAGHTEWTGKYDGKDYPIKSGTQPNSLSATRSIKRIDDRTYETVNKTADGQRMVRNRWVVSRDGKTMMQSQTGKNTQGQTVKNTGVWEKQ